MSDSQAIYVVAWEQTEADGLQAPPVKELDVGTVWRWQGDAVRLDVNCDAVILENHELSRRDRIAAADRLGKVLGSDVSPTRFDGPEETDAETTHSGLELTDGETIYSASLLFDREYGERPLILFRDRLPPRQKDVWVLSLTVAHHDKYRPQEEPATLCFTTGTEISTETGRVRVEDLSVGDRILTCDDGPQPLRWIGTRRVTGARLHAMPWLRPVQIRRGVLGLDQPDRELILSPDHRVLLSGGAAPDLFGEKEVLAAAKELVGNPGIRTLPLCSELTYFHLLFDRHQIVWANGVGCESFHPEGADLTHIKGRQRDELTSMLPRFAQSYGDFARRPLNTADFAMLAFGSGH